MKIKVLFFLITVGITAFNTIMASKIIVAGNIVSNTTWLADTVNVTGDLTIDSAVTLTINPGTRVEINNSIKIEVHGQIKALGLVNDTIYFYAKPGEKWGGLGFENPSVFPDSSIFQFCSFRNSRSSWYSTGAISLFNAKQVIFRHCLFRNNEGGFGDGGAMRMFDSDPLIEACTFIQNQCTGGGGAIYIESSQHTQKNSVPHIKDCIFKFNLSSAGYGGAIYGYRGSVDYLIEGCYFSHNQGDRGGALAFINTDPIIRNNVIVNSTANDHEGGGIYLGNADALVEGNRIDSNFAYSSSFQSRGGGIYGLFSNVNLLHNLMRGNESQYGGAISLNRGSFATIRGNLLDSNIARGHGGAIYGSGGFGGSVNMNIDSNFIYRNEVPFAISGALFAASSSTTMRVTRNRIEHNSYDGIVYGASYSNSGYEQVSDNIIQYNGGAGIRAAYVDVLNNQIGYNTAEGIVARDKVVIRDNDISYNGSSGIKVVNGNGDLRIEENHIYWNTDSLRAGGISLLNSGVQVVNNHLHNNSGLQGGGLGIYNSNPHISSNLIANNSADQGGAVYLNDDTSQPEFINNSMVNNSASTKGGGVYHHAQNIPDFTNNVLWGNEANSVPNQLYVHYDNQDPNFYHCSLEGGSAAFDLNFGFYSGTYQNNQSSLPGFVAPSSGAGYLADSLGLADWRLQKNSPLVDAGKPDTTGLNLPTQDVAGANRIQNDTVDIGAYESPEPLRFIVFSRNYSVCEGQSITFSASTNQLVLNYVWCKNGLTLQDSSLSTLVLLSPVPQDSGYYVLTAFTATDTVTDSLYLTVHPQAQLPPLQAPLACPGDTARLLAPAGYSSYLWSNGSQDSVLDVSQPGTYYYRVTDLNGCSTYSDTVQVSFLPAYTFSLGNDTALCSGDSLYLSTPPMATAISWSNGDTTANTVLYNPGALWVQFTDSSGCVKSDTLFVTVDSTTLNWPDSLVVSSLAPFVLNLPNGLLNIQWNTGSMADSLVIDPQSGLLPFYSVTALTANGCLIRDTVYIINTIGLETRVLTPLQLYPNPSQGSFYLQKPTGLQGNYELEVTDLTGRQIAVKIAEEGSRIHIKLNASNGLYRVVLREGDRFWGSWVSILH